MANTVRKFGLCGTSCCGKTTLSYAILSRLKKYGVLADTVSNLDRTFCWDLKYIETELAQNWHITNLISHEVERSLRDDVDVLITDRTPIDLFAYYTYQHNTPMSRALWEYIKEWAKTYESIYYMSPLEYQADNKRPKNEFRLAVNESLLELLTEIPNVKMLDRDNIFNDILTSLNLSKVTAKQSLTYDDIQCFANSLDQRIMLKISNNVDSISDQDLFIYGNIYTDRDKIYSFIRNAVGKYCKFDVSIIPFGYTLDFDYLEFTPQSTQLNNEVIYDNENKVKVHQEDSEDK